jgi:general secretion pathway protein J
MQVRLAGNLTVHDRAARTGRRRRDTVSGFTLFEALVATALMGVILAALANITAQWLPNWNRGIARAQRTELVSMALNRLAADLGASEAIPPNRTVKTSLFEGSEFSVTLVRTAVGPNPQPGLEIVRIAETTDRNGTALVRTTTPFAPFGPDGGSLAQMNFANPVALLHAPYRVSFAYAARDGVWKNIWRDEAQLPKLIRLTVRDAASQLALSISTTALVHVDMPAACAIGKDKTGCASQPGADNPQPTGRPIKADAATTRSAALEP